jgi:hypothetical protein
MRSRQEQRHVDQAASHIDRLDVSLHRSLGAVGCHRQGQPRGRLIGIGQQLVPDDAVHAARVVFGRRMQVDHEHVNAFTQRRNHLLGKVFDRRGIVLVRRGDNLDQRHDAVPCNVTNDERQQIG